MKSIIDWNELVPKLPKKMRDDLYLEAVAILSQEDDQEEREPTRTKKKKKGYRVWEKEGDHKHLAAPGRKFRINKRMKLNARVQWMNELWEKLQGMQNDVITYEGIASLYSGQKGVKGTVNLFIANMWARKFIDVVTT